MGARRPSRARLSRSQGCWANAKAAVREVQYGSSVEAPTCRTVAEAVKLAASNRRSARQCTLSSGAVVVAPVHGLTPPSSGQPPASFAGFRPPLMSYVRPFAC